MQGVETQLKSKWNLSFSIWKMAGPPLCLSASCGSQFAILALFLFFLLEVENTIHLVPQLLGGSWSSCPSGTWVRHSAVPANASDGKIINVPQREKPSRHQGASPHPCQTSSIAAVSQRTLRLMRVTVALKRFQVFLFQSRAGDFHKVWTQLGF